MLKNIKTLFIAGMLMAPTAFAQTQTQTMSLEDRVAELEANQSLNIFKFSGTFVTRYDTLSVQDATTAAGTALPDYKDLNYMRMRFSMNVDADVSRYIKFYSRFTSSKMFNQQNVIVTPALAGGDLTAGRDYRSAAVYLEKAYADLIIPDSNFVVSVGRLPTVEGEPMNYWDGRARLGTYPMLAYNAELDGLALSYKADQYMPTDHKLSFRLIYTPFANYNTAYLIPATQNDTGGSKLNSITDLLAEQIEYQTTTSFADNLVLIVQHFDSADIAINNPVVATDSLNLKISGTTLAASMGGIGGSPLDISLSYLFTQSDSNGLFTTAGGPVGYGTNTDSATLNGGMGVIAIRYRWSTWLAGFDYAHAEKDTFNPLFVNEDLSNFYSTPGNAFHVYATKKFTDSLSFRLGYRDQQYQYKPLTLGATQDSDEKVQTYYANLRLDF
jgi:hypothetical protein